MKEGWSHPAATSQRHYIRGSRPICGEQFFYKGHLRRVILAGGCNKCWRTLAKEQAIPAPPPRPPASVLNNRALSVTMRFNPVELASLDGICKFHATSRRFLGGSQDEQQVAAQTRAISIRIHEAYARARQKLDAAIAAVGKLAPITPPLQHSTTPPPPRP